MTIGFVHSCTLKRYSSTVDAEGTPTGATTDITTFKGVCHEYTSIDHPDGGTRGEETIAHCLVPYGIAGREQDLLAVTFRDGTVKTYKVRAVRDNHIFQRFDLVRYLP